MATNGLGYDLLRAENRQIFNRINQAVLEIQFFGY